VEGKKEQTRKKDDFGPKIAETTKTKKKKKN